MIVQRRQELPVVTSLPRKWSNVVAASLVAVLATAFGGFAAAGGSSAPDQPTASAIVNQLQRNGGVFPGYRRNHAKGVCISGYFQSSGKLARYSAARVFVSGQRTPVVGRLSIPGSNPYTWDDNTPIRGMALEFTQTDGQQWRTAMNAVPVFPVATPAADYEFMQAQQPDPATGDPDPKKLAAFFASHPRANAFRIWDRTTQPSASFATVRYNSLDAFELVDARGRRHAVRWSMAPQAIADGSRAPVANPNYLVADLRVRLSRKPLQWRLMMTFANHGDPTNDASVAWPTDRRHVDAGMLVIQASQPQADGPCRDINFDPLVLPAGIEPSDDPLLQFRAKAYAESHHRRIRDEARASGTDPARATVTQP